MARNNNTSELDILPDEISSKLRVLLETSVALKKKMLPKKGYIPLDEEAQEMYYKILPYLFDTSNEVRNWLLSNHFCVLRIKLHSPDLGLFTRI